MYNQVKTLLQLEKTQFQDDVNVVPQIDTQQVTTTAAMMKSSISRLTLSLFCLFLI